MLSVITGKQRSGKTYYTTKEVIIPFLKDSDRPIFTNLPLNPDYIVRFISNGPFFQEKLFERFYLFLDTNFQSLRDFARKNRVFWKWYTGSKEDIPGEQLDSGVPKKKRINSHIISSVNVKQFWDFILPNSVVVFDEIYEFFSVVDAGERNQENNEIRKKLLYFSRQHGHLKTDIFLISHSLQDLDPFIRRGTQYLYEVRNSKYTNMFENAIFRGLKYPVQFFIVCGYEFGEKKPSDKWYVSTDKRIFKCYNSFSHSSKLGFKKVNDSMKSIDTDSNSYNFKRFFSQFGVWISVFIGVGIGVYLSGSMVWKMAGLSTKDVNKALGRDGGTSKTIVKDSQVEGLPGDAKKIDYKITMRTSERIVYSDGFKVLKGGELNGFKVKSIEKDFIVLTDSSNKQFRVAIAGIRK